MSPTSMSIDDLPKPMVDKYLNRFRNATKSQKQRVETCLSALSCVLSEKTNLPEATHSSCYNLETECVASNPGISSSSNSGQNTDVELDDDANMVSSKRLAITYLNGKKWSQIQRRKLLECKTENLLCQLPKEPENFDGVVILDPFEIDIRDDSIDTIDPFAIEPRSFTNFQDENEVVCVNGKNQLHPWILNN